MSKQKIVVFGTGGTIAGKAASMSDNVGYKAGEVAIGELLANIPGMQAALQGHELVAQQVAQIDSKDMGFDVWRALAMGCRDAMADPDVRGIVITHGTDTLEETAWFLQCILSPEKPVVLTSAMRPATALSPDGPQNLLDAVAVALEPDARDVLAVAAGAVHEARWVHKAFPYRVDAFSSGEAGPCGWVEEGQVRWLRRPSTQANSSHTALLNDLPAAQGWPWVEVVLSAAGASGRAVDALVDAQVKGLVVASTGNGSLHHALKDALLRASERGVRVVKATRCGQGQSLVGDLGDFPSYAGLSPIKARVALLLDLLAERAMQISGV